MAALCCASRPQAAACAAGGTASRARSARRTLELASHAFTRRPTRCCEGDRAAFFAWLPVDGSPAAVEAQDGLWPSLRHAFARCRGARSRSTSRPSTRRSGVYRVAVRGQLGGAGPPDRLAVVRYLKLRTSPTAPPWSPDETPEDLRRRYLMALHDPVVLQRPGLIVLADRWARDRAGEVLAAAARARPRLAALGVGDAPDRRSSPSTARSRTFAMRLGFGADSSRLVFFSHPSLRVADEDWPTYDVGVMGPWLRDLGAVHGRVLDARARPRLHVAAGSRGSSTRRRCSSRGSPRRRRACRRLRRCAMRSPPAISCGRCPSRSPTPMCGRTRGSEEVEPGLPGRRVARRLRRLALGRRASCGPFVQAVAAGEPTEAGMDERARRRAGRDVAPVLRGLAPLRARRRLRPAA